MITFSKLGRHGQLGNQLFQYALLLGVRGKKGYEIVIPKEYHGEKKKGLVELEPFEITAKSFTTKHAQAIKKTYIYNDMIFRPEVFHQPDNTDFQGYFQSEKYFKHVESEVRLELNFRYPYRAVAGDYIRTHCQSDKKIVCIHVRRGDYLKNPEIFWQLPTKYYLKGLEQLPSDFGTVLVFSDDPAWCKIHFPSSFKIVSCPSHWHDMCVMTCCDYFILSPSSFGWWGAWLARSPSKVVIAPDPWFVPKCKYKGKDVVPESWIKSEVTQYQKSAI